MSRRVPEIQRAAVIEARHEENAIEPRSEENATEARHEEKAIKARESVVFQIMQVLSAPLIAVTAFAAFEPDTMTAAALIGFISGFASEMILKKLRQAGDAVVGKYP